MPVKIEARELSRREVRYRLYRIQSDAVLDPRDGLKSHFETQEDFDGWHNFAKTWDVGPAGEWPEGHFVVVTREYSQDDAWGTVLADQAVTFGTADAQSGDVEERFEEHLAETGEGAPDNQALVTGDNATFGGQ